MQSNDYLAQDQYGQASFSTLSGILNRGTWRNIPWCLRQLNWAGDRCSALDLSKTHGRQRLGWRSAPVCASNLPMAGMRRTATRRTMTSPTASSIRIRPSAARPCRKIARNSCRAAHWSGLRPIRERENCARASFGVHRALLDTLDYRLDQTAPFNSTLSYSNTTVAISTSFQPLRPRAAEKSHPAMCSATLRRRRCWRGPFRIEQQIAPDTALAVGYVGSHAYHQILSEDENTPRNGGLPSDGLPCIASAGTVYYPSHNHGQSEACQLHFVGLEGITNYNALEVDVRRQCRQRAAVARRLHVVKESR